MTTPSPPHPTTLRLRESAASYARSALVHVTDDHDRVRGAVDAGIAVEHMAKAALANLNPALLADRNANLDTMLHLTGLGHLAKCGPHEIKTIGAHEACVRCARLIPGFTFAPQRDHAVIVVRNGGAHMALASEDSARESARIMVRLIEPLITYQELDRSAFWGAMLSVADTLLDEKTTQISAVLEMKIASARTRLEGRLAGLGNAERALVLRTLSAHPPFSRDEQPHECPACGQEGVVICELHDVGQPEFDYEQVDVDDFVYHGGYIDQIAYAVNFDCDACGLDIDYDEMTAADMITEFDREPRSCEPWEFESEQD